MAKKKIAAKETTAKKVVKRRAVIAKPEPAVEAVNVDAMFAQVAEAQEDAPAPTKKKKAEKLVITLEDKASDLLWLMKAKDEAKTLKGKIDNIESVLSEEIEEQRLCLNQLRQEYIGSVNIRATGNDENGEPINTGLRLYYRQNRHTPHDNWAKSKDDELQAEYGGKATVRDEAINSIAQALIDAGEECDYDIAAAIYDERMESENSLIIDGPTLAAHPEIFQMLAENGLLKFVTRVSKTKPTEAFYKRSNWDARERIIMNALKSIGICKQAKATIK